MRKSAKPEVAFDTPFAEPVATAQLDDIDNRAIADHILDLERRGGGGTGRGYWRTAVLNNTESAALRALESRVHEVAAAYLQECGAGLAPVLQHYWAQVYRAGGYVSPHTHPAAFLSAVYYPLAGKSAAPIRFDRANKDALVFVMDRFRPETGPLTRQWFLVKPVTGLLIVFPAWLSHWVPPGAEPESDETRICVAFNYGGKGPDRPLPYEKYL
jgi:uncharacterized protein (TIGR02466 family)